MNKLELSGEHAAANDISTVSSAAVPVGEASALFAPECIRDVVRSSVIAVGFGRLILQVYWNTDRAVQLYLVDS